MRRHRKPLAVYMHKVYPVRTGAYRCGFEEPVGKHAVWTSKRKDSVIASGQIVKRFPTIDGPAEIGKWLVKWDGAADVSLGDAKFLDQPTDQLDRSLNAA